MSTEKIIKNQAKNSLHGNWSVIIAAVFAVCTVMILIEALLYSCCFFLKIINPETGTVYSTKEIPYIIISAAAALIIFFASPLFNGIIKMFCNVSIYNRTDIFDLFFFFRGAKRYFKTALINLVLFFIYSIISYGLDVYAYACEIYGASLYDGLSFDVTTFTLIGAFLVSAVIKTVVFLLFAYFPITAYSFNDSLPASRYMFGFIGFSFRHFSASAKLVLSFLGWIVLSCALVVPAFYTLPYIMTSMATSAKWLFALERDRGVI